MQARYPLYFENRLIICASHCSSYIKAAEEDTNYRHESINLFIYFIHPHFKPAPEFTPGRVDIIKQNRTM
jgi:hypothetical protein